MNRSTQSSIYVDNIKEEVLKVLNKLLDDQNSYLKGHNNKLTKLRSEVVAINMKIDKAKTKYVNALKESDEALYDCESIRLNPNEYIKGDPEIKTKLNIKATNLLKALKDSCDEYIKFNNSTNIYQSQYNETLNEILIELQIQEEQRIQTIKESLQKLVIFETSMLQNNRYDLEHINNVINAIDNTSDIKKIIEKESIKPVNDSIMK